MWALVGTLTLAVLVIGAWGAPMTDEETYTQLAQFVETHSQIPADAALVQRILTSDRWAALHAQYGSKKKEAATSTKHK